LCHPRWPPSSKHGESDFATRGNHLRLNQRRFRSRTRTHNCGSRSV
jgi:hypothetical protein